MDLYSTGNTTVDAVGKLNITGNIIPENWYKTVIKKKTGKPNLRAIMFLADIIYWYRPTEIRDEITGQVLGYKKKMHEDKLQRSYLDWSNKFGCSKGEATTTIDELEELGVINKDFRTILKHGIRSNNVLYIGLNVDKLIELTYPLESYSTCISKKEKQIATPKKMDRLQTKMDIALEKNEDTNTESIQENFLEINHSFEPDSMTEELEMQVKNELINKGCIPYNYNKDMRKMTLAIRYITDWDACYTDYDDIVEQKTYNLAIDALIEMACSKEIKKYNGRNVSYVYIIDKINQNIDREGRMNIRCIIEQAVQDYIKSSNKKEIKHPKNYLKSCILDSFDTYEIKFNSYFNRSYYKQTNTN